MTIKNINIGAAPDDGTGDPLRTAFEKINDNFQEVKTAPGTPGPAGPAGATGPQRPAHPTSATDHPFSTVRCRGTGLLPGDRTAGLGHLQEQRPGSSLTPATRYLPEGCSPPPTAPCCSN